MIKWRLRILSQNTCDYGKPFDGSMRDKDVCLCCYDLGELEFADLREYSDNYPYFSGFFIAEGVAFHLTQKISATIVYKGVYLDSDEELMQTIPDEIPFDVNNDESDRRTISKAELKKLTAGINKEYYLHYYVTDPRIILLSLFVMNPAEKFILRHRGDFPTREEAVRFFAACGFPHRFHPHPPNKIMNLDVYGLLKKLYDRWKETYCRTVSVSKPDDPDSEILAAPDERNYKYLKTLKTAGVFAVKDKERIFYRLQPGSRLHCLREPENPYDANAVYLKSDFFGYRIGYVPKVEAAKLAPLMDEGTSFCAIVKRLDEEKKLIEFDLYKKLRRREAEVKRITLNISTGYALYEYQLDGTDCRIALKERAVPFTWASGTAEKRFSREKWEEKIVKKLAACNFTTWQKLYPGEARTIKWEIKVVLDDDCVIRSYGNDSYPPEWPIVSGIFRDYLKSPK